MHQEYWHGWALYKITGDTHVIHLVEEWEDKALHVEYGVVQVAAASSENGVEDAVLRPISEFLRYITLHPTKHKSTSY